MSLFGIEDSAQYKKVAEVLLKKLNDEYTSGYKFGYEEYSGRDWQAKSWKDDLEKFLKYLQAEDLKKALLLDAKTFGIGLGRMNGMLNSGLNHLIAADDSATMVVKDIIEKVKKIESFEVKNIKNRIKKIKIKDSTHEPNHKMMMDACNNK